MSAGRKSRSRAGALFVVAACALAMLAGCSDPAQTFRPADPLPPQPPQPPQVFHAPEFGPLTQKGRVFTADPSLTDLYTKFHGASLFSRFVLYDDSTFALQFASAQAGLFDYEGKYSRVGSQIVFTWKGWSTAGPWGAEATLHGDSLTVSYNLIMQLTDFIDGTYRGSPP